MKRTGYLYNKLLDIEFIKQTIIKASKGKKKRKQVIKVLSNIDYYSNELLEMFKSDNFVFGKIHSRTIKERHKERLITISPFYPNQVLDYLLVEVVKPIIYKGMYQYCVGNVDKKGITYGKKYVEKNIHKYKYFVKLDIHKFYPSVNVDILLKLLEKKIKDQRFINFATKVMKRFNELPIGCYYSQWLSNYYLQELDHYIKEKLHIECYVRYVDDMVLMSNNKKKLKGSVYQIEKFLKQLDLSLKRYEIVREINKCDIDFLGFKFNTKHTYLRKELFYKIRKKINYIKKTKHICVSQARSLLSMIGWFKQLKTGYAYYKNNIKDFIKIGYLKHIVSNYERKLNYDTTKNQTSVLCWKRILCCLC